MYLSRFLLGFLIIIVANTGFAQKKQAHRATNFVQVSKKDRRYLELSNGTLFIPIGPNICFPRFITEEAEIINYYEHYFQQLAANGGNYTRIWLSAPVFEVECKEAGKYDMIFAQRIDKVVRLAQKYDIKIKFCLEHFRDITNLPAKFAGSVAFDRPVYAAQVPDIQAFFTSESAKKLYLDRVDFFAKRYGDNPTILGWELWNEIDAVPLPEDKILYEWTAAMLYEVQKRLPNQLILQSLGSFDAAAKIPTYRQYMQLPANMLAQAHRYLDAGASLAICQAPIDELASDAVRTLQSFTPDKPVLLSEVGAVEPHHAGPWKLYEDDTLGILLHDLLFAPFFAGAAGPGQSWHWDYYIEHNNLWWHFARFKNAIQDFNPIAEKAVPTFKKLDNRLKIYGLQGKKTTLLWIRDGANNWKTELVDAQKADVVRNCTLHYSDIKIKKVTFYDPWKDRWETGKINPDGTITLPDFTRSMIVKLQH